jgi:fucose permease
MVRERLTTPHTPHHCRLWLRFGGVVVVVVVVVEQLLDVLNAHFQQVFGINKLQSTMLQLAYFVRLARMN